MSIDIRIITLQWIFFLYVYFSIDSTTVDFTILVTPVECRENKKRSFLLFNFLLIISMYNICIGSI